MFLLHLEQGSSGQIMHMHMLQASLRKCVTILAVMFHAKQGTVLKRLTTQPRISTALAKRLTSCQSSYMVATQLENQEQQEQGKTCGMHIGYV